MDRFVALYRGINVGGRNAVKMEALRAMHERLGHKDVSTYIQSGNVVFSAKGQPAPLTKKIAAQFALDHGFTARVIVVPASRWATLVTDNPYAKFAQKDPKSVHAAICDGPPSAKGLRGLLAKAGGTETFVIKGEVLYLHAPDGFGTSKFAAGMEKASGVPMTARNWRTVEALSKLINPLGRIP
ncbi:MAG: DUF1697 domain-containing protein [Planctomycetota bacterium]|mgnify:CR=1 FL=1